MRLLPFSLQLRQGLNNLPHLSIAVANAGGKFVVVYLSIFFSKGLRLLYVRRSFLDLSLGFSYAPHDMPLFPSTFLIETLPTYLAVIAIYCGAGIAKLQA